MSSLFLHLPFKSCLFLHLCCWVLTGFAHIIMVNRAQCRTTLTHWRFVMRKCVCICVRICKPTILRVHVFFKNCKEERNAKQKREHKVFGFRCVSWIVFLFYLLFSLSFRLNLLLGVIEVQWNWKVRSYERQHILCERSGCYVKMKLYSEYISDNTFGFWVLITIHVLYCLKIYKFRIVDRKGSITLISWLWFEHIYLFNDFHSSFFLFMNCPNYLCFYSERLIFLRMKKNSQVLKIR